MAGEEFDMMLFLLLKLRKNSNYNVKKEQKFWIRKIFEKSSWGSARIEVL